MLLVRDTGRELLIGRIVEVEAYLDNDPASHSYRGTTQRNSVMFAEGGRLYVYFTYGMHFCANVVTEKEGKGCAVLLRGVEPLEGISLMARRRGMNRSRIGDLCNGPAKLCQAFAIGRRENGTDLCDGRIWISRPGALPRLRRIIRTPRIGITKGTKRLWRFVLAEPPYRT